MLDMVEDTLLARWHLHIKRVADPVSLRDTVSDKTKWQPCRTIVALGHRVSNTGAIQDCLRHTSRQMWRAFFAAVPALVRKRLPSNAFCILISVGVVPVLDYRSTRWPASKTTERHINRLQRKMIACTLNLKKRPDEDVAAFVRRRGKVARVHAIADGLWSRRHCHRLCTWSSHLERAPGDQGWAWRLLRHRGREWLMARRMAEGSSSAFAGRTSTRSMPGGVAIRWQDGLEFARVYLRVSQSPENLARELGQVVPVLRVPPQ